MTRAALSATPGTGTTVPAPARWLFVLAGTLGIIGYLVPALRRLGYPYELSFFEGSTVEVTGRLVDGLALYGPPSPEFTPWPYPPMYFWLTAGAAELLGLSLPAMRMVSVAASLAVLALIGVVVHRLTGSGPAAVLGAGLYAATYRVGGAWADTARVDSMLLAVAMVLIVVAMRARTWRGGLAVGLLVVVGFLTKQNALIAAAPVLAVLLVRRREAGIVATAVGVGGSVVSVLLGDVATDGWYSPYVVGQLLGHPMRAEWFVWFWLVDVLLPVALVVIVVALLTWRHRRQRAYEPRMQWASIPQESVVVAAGVVGLLLAALAGRLHEGGSSNVAMPAHLATAMVVAVAMHRLAASGLLSRPELWLLGSVAVAQVVVLQFWRTDIVPTPADGAAGDRFIADLAELPAPVLVTSHPYYARLAGQPTASSTIAVVDLLDTRSTRALDELTDQLPWSLDGVNTVVVDNEATSYLFGDALERDFTRVESEIIPGDDFVPVNDVPVKPRLVYVRTSEVTR